MSAPSKQQRFPPTNILPHSTPVPLGTLVFRLLLFTVPQTYQLLAAHLDCVKDVFSYPLVCAFLRRTEVCRIRSFGGRPSPRRQ